MPYAPKRHGQKQQEAAREAYRKQHDRRRGSSAERGYNNRWHKYSNQLCRERIFCELCAAIGIDTPVVRHADRNGTGERRKIISVVDHIVPVAGADDPLFWEPWNHWCLCVACDRWKSATFDGGYGHTVKVATRTQQGAIQRRSEVVEAMRNGVRR